MIEDTILDTVWPSDEEARQAEEQFTTIREFIESEHSVEARLMGSLAKRTFLAGDKDLDIFIFFPPDTDRDELEDRGLEIGKAVFTEFDGDYVVEYSEHPYTKGTINSFEVEIVPAYNIDRTAQLRSAVDRTPFHTSWVNDNLSTAEKKQVVLLKAFLKGRDLYGSTLRIEGFSGYLCELLIAEYGSFKETLAAAADWNEQENIDPADHHDQLPDELKERFEDDNLVMIDPTDPHRNVAAVLNTENYSRFIYESWRYTKEPRKDLFQPDTQIAPEEVIQEEIEKRGDMYVIAFDRPEDMTDDLLYPQLRRLLRRIKQLIRKHEFNLFDADFFVGEEIRIVLDFNVSTLPAKEKHSGPAVFHNPENLANFTQKYENTWIEDTRLVTIVERTHTDAESMLRAFLDGDLQQKGVPENLIESVADRTIRKPQLNEKEWRRFLTSFLHITT